MAPHVKSNPSRSSACFKPSAFQQSGCIDDLGIASTPWVRQFVIASAVVLLDSGISEAPSSYLIEITVTMMLAGLTEEVTCRAILVVGERRPRLTQGRVVVFPSAWFGLFHLLRWPLGEELATTIRQVVVTTIMGGALSALRRLSGTLVTWMALNVAYDCILIQQYFD